MSKRAAAGYVVGDGLALRFHFLMQALDLGLLSGRLEGNVRALAAAEGAEVERWAREVRAAFLDAREGMGLGDLEWPAGEEAGAWGAARRSLARWGGGGAPRDEAERLGAFCEEMSSVRDGRRVSGAYYTPGWAARAVAGAAVRGVLEGRARRGAKEALDLRVLDPAAGAGSFLVGAVEAVAEAAGEGPEGNEVRRAAARECVFGVETNPLAAEACRLGVWLAASRPGRPAAVPAGHVRVGDALADRPEAGAFDLVVGNPPWGVKLAPDSARRLAGAWPEALGGHRDSYLFFLQLAAECAREEGGIGMLLPDAVLWQVRYEGMRRALLKRFRPARVMLLGEKIFPGATAPACGVCLVGKEISAGEVRTSDLRRVGRAELAEAANAGGWTAPVESVFESPHHSFLVAPEWQRKLLARMSARHGMLGDLEDRFEFHDGGINYPRAEVGRRVLYEGEQRDSCDIPVVRGRDFGALSDIGHSAWLRHDWRERMTAGDGLAVREGLYRRAPKLLLRQTGDRPVATVDRRGVYFGRSVIAITGECERDLLWLAAVLNSNAAACLYRALAPEGGRTFAQVKVGKLRPLPVPRSGREDEVAEMACEMIGERDEARRGELAARIEEAVAGAYGLSEGERKLAAEAVSGSARSGRSRRGRRAGTW